MPYERPCAWTVRTLWIGRTLWAPRTLVSLATALALLAASPPVKGQESQEGQQAAKKSLSLAEALAGHRLPLALEEGRLTGPGAEWLWSRAADSAVVTLGESHATREAPQVMAAIVSSLRPEGFHHLVIETGPWTAEKLTALLRQGGSAYEDYLRAYPLAIPFYNLRQERELLEGMVADNPAADPLWGVDQTFVLSTPALLARLEEIAPTEAARAAVEAFLAAHPVAPEAPPQANPLALTQLEPGVFDPLRPHFQDSPEGRRILDELAESAAIYQLYVAGENLESNRRRAIYMRRNVSDRFHAALKERSAQRESSQIPRFVVKLGGAHAYRGRTTNNVFDVGNLALALADEVGMRALNVAVYCGPGSQAAGFLGGSSDCWAENSMLHGAFEEAAGEGWALFDLEAVRPLLHRRRIEELAPATERFLWAFDALILLPGTHPASRIVALAPADGAGGDSAE